jgi:hypothetical protein
VKGRLIRPEGRVPVRDELEAIEDADQRGMYRVEGHPKPLTWNDLLRLSLRDEGLTVQVYQRKRADSGGDDGSRTECDSQQDTKGG